MLSIGQRARLIAAIPDELAGYTIKKLRRDRLGNDDYEFPTMRIAILSQGIRVHPSTGGPIRKNYDGYQGDVQQWIGEYQRASVSLTILCESETSKTDQETPEILDTILYALQQEISIWRLGLYWPTDYMKVVPGSIRVTYLPCMMASTIEHWIYPANVDFTIEYEFSAIDPTPNIHAIGYDWSFPCGSENHVLLSNYHPPWYGMDVILKGCSAILPIDILLHSLEKYKNYSIDMLLINDITIEYESDYGMDVVLIND